MSKKLPFVMAAASAAALVLVSGTAIAQSGSTSGEKSSKSMSMSSETGSMAKSADGKFVMAAAKGGMAEVEMGRLAAEKASNPEVKQFGQKMVDDHSKANDDLKRVASSRGMTLPTEVDAADKAKMDRMSKLSGAAFDKAYVADMLKDHKKDVADFKKEASGGKDSDVKSFASKTLPTLQEHLKMVQDLSSKVAGKAAGSR